MTTRFPMMSFARGLPVAPMRAAVAEAPFDSPDYVFEVKWDGIRCVCTIRDGAPRLYTRTGRDITERFPEFKTFPDAIGARQAVLDGELCVLDGSVPSFYSIQRRHVLRDEEAIRQAAENDPALYVVFDLLHKDGTDLLQAPWSQRRSGLEHIWRGDDHAILSDAISEQGRMLYDAAVARGLEGIVAKRVDSPYVPGRRTDYWLKIRHRRQLDAVIGGYTPRGRDDFASLALGLYGPRADGARVLLPIGYVGTGFSASIRRSVLHRMKPLHIADSPFTEPPPHRADGSSSAVPGHTRWIHPQLVCRVEYLQFTPDGHLRHPSFIGLRDDKPAAECTFESLRPGPTHERWQAPFPKRSQGDAIERMNETSQAPSAHSPARWSRRT